MFSLISFSIIPGLAPKARQWATLAPSSVTFKNAYKVRKPGEDEDDPKPVPHCFTFLPRSGGAANNFYLMFSFTTFYLSNLASSFSVTQGFPREALDMEKTERIPRRLQDANESSKDIFCMVKYTMACPTLSQPPLLVCPGSLQAEARHFVQRANTTPLVQFPVYEDDRIAEIKRLSRAIFADFPSMRRAVTFYQSIVDQHGRDNDEQYPQLTFLRNAPCDVPDVHNFQLGERPAPPVPHSLQVVFHRWFISLGLAKLRYIGEPNAARKHVLLRTSSQHHVCVIKQVSYTLSNSYLDRTGLWVARGWVSWQNKKKMKPWKLVAQHLTKSWPTLTPFLDKQNYKEPVVTCC